MSSRALTSPVIAEDRAQPVPLQIASLTLDEAGAPRRHRSKKSETSVPTSSGPGSHRDEMIVETVVKPVISAARPRKISNSDQMPRVSTTSDQPSLPRSVSADEDPSSAPSPASSQVSFRLSNSSIRPLRAAGLDSEEEGLPDVPTESRRVRPASSAATAWDRIQQLRVDTWSLRSRIHEIRSNLRELQRAKSDADDILFRRLTILGLGGLGFANEILPLRHQKELPELMHDCQAARDAYGPLEDDCNDLEDQLSAKEFELDRLEEAFYKRAPEDVTIASDRPLTPAGLEDPGNYPISVGYSDHEDEILEFHPLVSRFLDKLGDLDLLKERLDDLIDEKRAMEEERVKRGKFGYHLSEDDTKWLADAHNVEEGLTDQIRALEKELEYLKADCLEKGLVDKDGEPTGFLNAEQQTFTGDADVDPRGHTSEYVKFPILLRHPGFVRPDHKADRRTGPLTRADTRMMKGILSSAETYPTTLRINEWLLFRLRESALDVNLLVRTFQAFSSIFNIFDDRWQFAVLDFWFRDPTMRNPRGGRRVDTDSLTTQPDKISSPSDRIKALDRRQPGRVVPFNERFSQVTTSELEYDEVEIKEARPRRREKKAITNTEEIFPLF